MRNAYNNAVLVRGVLITRSDRIVMRRGDENIIIRWRFISRGDAASCVRARDTRVRRDARSSSYGHPRT